MPAAEGRLEIGVRGDAARGEPSGTLHRTSSVDTLPSGGHRYKSCSSDSSILRRYQRLVCSEIAVS